MNDAYKSNLVAPVFNRALEKLKIYKALPRNGDFNHLGTFCFGQPMDGIENCMMFKGGDDYYPTFGILASPFPKDSLNRKIICLSSASGKNYLARLASNQGCNSLTRLFEVLTNFSPITMKARGITELTGLIDKCLERHVIYRRGGSIIKIDARHGLILKRSSDEQVMRVLP